MSFVAVCYVSLKRFAPMSFAFYLCVEASHAPDPSVALVSAFRGFVDSLRPHDVAGRASGIEPLLVELRAHTSDRELLSNAALALLSKTKQVSLFADAGILPPTGFVAELYRRVSHRILPDVLGNTYLRDVTEQIFHDQRDDQWLANVPIEQWRELISLLQPEDGNACSLAKKQLDMELRNAVNVLSVRLAALGLDNALLRAPKRIISIDRFQNLKGFGFQRASSPIWPNRAGKLSANHLANSWARACGLTAFIPTGKLAMLHSPVLAKNLWCQPLASPAIAAFKPRTAVLRPKMHNIHGKNAHLQNGKGVAVRCFGIAERSGNGRTGFGQPAI